MFINAHISFPFFFFPSFIFCGLVIKKDTRFIFQRRLKGIYFWQVCNSWKDALLFFFILHYFCVSQRKYSCVTHTHYSFRSSRHYLAIFKHLLASSIRGYVNAVIIEIWDAETRIWRYLAVTRSAFVVEMWSIDSSIHENRQVEYNISIYCKKSIALII